MRCNVYDFDYTIYDGDSTLDFYKFAIKKHPLVLIALPGTLFAWILYFLRIYSKTQVKEKFYAFLKYIRDIDCLINDFWDIHQSKIKKWYSSKYHKSDIIISASPEFLLAPICQRMNIGILIASDVNKKTGEYTGVNCYGEEKVNRLNREVPGCIVEEFYSDSLSDEFLARNAIKSFIVHGEEIIDWKWYHNNN